MGLVCSFHRNWLPCTTMAKTARRSLIESKSTGQNKCFYKIFCDKMIYWKLKRDYFDFKFVVLVFDLISFQMLIYDLHSFIARKHFRGSIIHLPGSRNLVIFFLGVQEGRKSAGLSTAGIARHEVGSFNCLLCTTDLTFVPADNADQRRFSKRKIWKFLFHLFSPQKIYLL